MHLVWKRMESLIEELRQRDDMTEEEKFSAIMLAIEAYGLKRTPSEIELIRKCLHVAEVDWQERHKMP